jgi:hypothetical protein
MDIEEAKEYFRNCLDDEYNFKNATRNKDKKAIEILLNELDENSNIISDLQNEVTLKQCELDKKDKIIDLMAEMLVKDHEWFYSEFDNYTKQDFIEYFTNKVDCGEK